MGKIINSSQEPLHKKMSDRSDVDARQLERNERSAGTLISNVLEKCQSEINSAGERRAAVESIVKRNVRGFGLIIRSRQSMTSNKPFSIWFFPDVDRVAIESCYPNRPHALSHCDADELDEQFVWGHVSRFLNDSA